MTSQIILASRSPRRKDILEKLGLVFEIDPPEIDETPRHRENPLSYVQRIAAAKADIVALRHEQQCVIIAADTTVALDGEIFGQPRDLDEARRMIQKLSKGISLFHTIASWKMPRNLAPKTANCSASWFTACCTCVVIKTRRKRTKA